MSLKNLIALAALVLLFDISGCGIKQASETDKSDIQHLPAPPKLGPRVAESKREPANIAPANKPAAPKLKAKPAVREQSAAAYSSVAPSAGAKFSLEPIQSPQSRISRQSPYSTAASAPEILARIRPGTELQNRENYQHYRDNPIKVASEEPLSTFSIDVDTGSYSNSRRLLNEGHMPVKDAVRAEEFINYFHYDYPAPEGEQAFSVNTEVGPSPWNPHALLLHIGIQGKRIAQQNLPPSNLVFLIDVSGSMQSANKLQLLVKGLKMLTQQLRAQDRVAMVVYAGASGLVLDSTSGADKNTILTALDQLRAGGSTNGASGIRLAYQTARAAFLKNGSNRIILATDGDFNVGTVNFEALKDLVSRQRESGIELTTLGFGSGNYNDKLLEQLADAGNGNYAYIDSLMEAQKTLVEQLGGTLHTIAKDVKIQIEFNPNVVREYRLIGYENRRLRREDFNNDKVDAGEIGAGHSVTALYEIVLVASEAASIDPLRYAKKNTATLGTQNSELAFLKLRYKKPKNDSSELISKAISIKSVIASLDKTSDNFRFAASVAAFAQLLRGGKYIDDKGSGFNLDSVIALAQQSKGKDNNGYRSEYIRLLKLSQALMPSLAGLQ